jgi:bis(5'-nucleosyl)-tetraphosphatase (symmetrical)
MSTYCIGDVQGCFDELQALLKLINFNQKDTLWFTGDLVNRGPQSLEVLRFVKSLNERSITVLGNHDLHLLAVVNQSAPSQKQDDLQDILDAPDCDQLCEWLRHQPLIHHDLGYTLVHAGIPPQWDLDTAIARAKEVQDVLCSDQYKKFTDHMYGDQPDCWSDDLRGWERLRVITNYFTRLRFCDKNGKVDLKLKGEPHHASAGFMPWFKIPSRLNKNLTLLFGHWAALQGETDEPHVYALDTGCVWGHRLTALRLEDKQKFSLPCKTYQKLP